jgi:hypothetical protein
MHAKEEVVLYKIEDFLSLSSDKLYTAAARSVDVFWTGWRTVLDLGGLQPTEPLTGDQWNWFCDQVKTPFDNCKSEGRGIHPTVREIFEACNKLSGNQYVLAFENKLVHSESLVKRPDISILMYLAVGDSIEGVVLPVEIKNFQDLESAMYRALGYLVSKIQNLLDLHGFDVSIKGFCMGTDGFTLSLGYVSVENRELLVASTGLDGDQLWEEGGNPGTRLT